MINDKNKEKSKKIIEVTKKKGLIKKYSEFCKTQEGEKSKLSQEEVNYYISKNKNKGD